MMTHSPSKSNIEEANKHIQLLYGRVAELEQKYEEKCEAKLQSEAYHSQLIQTRDVVIKELKQNVENKDVRIRGLVEHLKNREVEVQNLKYQISLMTDMLKYRPVLENLIGTMKECDTMVRSQSRPSSLSSGKLVVRPRNSVGENPATNNVIKQRIYEKPKLDSSPTRTSPTHTPTHNASAVKNGQSIKNGVTSMNLNNTGSPYKIKQGDRSEEKGPQQRKEMYL